jgi:mannose-1-phosphate guanylyltransferase
MYQEDQDLQPKVFVKLFGRFSLFQKTLLRNLDTMNFDYSPRTVAPST